MPTINHAITPFTTSSFTACFTAAPVYTPTRAEVVLLASMGRLLPAGVVGCYGCGVGKTELELLVAAAGALDQVAGSVAVTDDTAEA